MSNRREATWRLNPLDEYLGSVRIAEVLESPRITDEERVTELLALANGAPLYDSVLDAMMDGTRVNSTPDVAIEREIREGDLWRDTVVSALASLLPVGVKPAAASRATEQAAETLQRCTERALISIPTVAIRNGRMHLEHRVIAKDVGGAIGYAFAIAGSDEYSRRLRRCGCSSCGNFFLIQDRGSSPGRRQDKFCSDPCATKGARERIRETMRAKRSAKANVKQGKRK